ncbi:hypothetical protein [Streptomyces sp. AM 3-1-1]|uniref:hypothetical protein n=1 Tax=Streptomyces sp. AM 3-1-1 TaxID=3028711 RepID=UPI0023B8916A|nr:hypothetical protein [Streptomyces sp. AM 3-1-1]WEH27801.1 hypothetical protein P0D76_10970 [Streptomyces sp. AM 3-1-1]
MTEQPPPREGQRPEPIPPQAKDSPRGSDSPPPPPDTPPPAPASPPPSGVRGPVQPAASEATRLLCVGVHHDRAFREAVIDELYVHEERFPAPSTGIDAGRVLSHAVRARNQDVAWAAGILGLWLLGLVVTGGLLILALFGSVGLVVARWIRGTGPLDSGVALARRVVAFWVRWMSRLYFVYLLVIVLLFTVFLGGTTFSGGTLFSGTLTVARLSAVLTLFVLGGIVACVALRRGQFDRVVSEELSPARFPHVSGDPAETGAGERLVRLRARLRAEQHQPLVMYEEDWPFRGFGTPFRTWSLAIELRPRGEAAPVPLDNGEILRRIVPLVEALRVPSPRRDPAVAGSVIDRLRELRLDECVFLPADGIEFRDAAPYTPEAYEAHRAAALEEGGEARRHFLRIRVGGWDEELVVTVFVRVHTQGGMLMAEFAPHVLQPVRRAYRLAERDARRHRALNGVGHVAWAVVHTPASFGQAVRTLGGWLRAELLRLLAGYGGAPAEGPSVAVRELGTDEDLSLFQEMDLARYLKTIQDRVAGGVRTALREAGWATDEFDQKIVHVANGGVYIDSAKDSAIGIGDDNTISHTTSGQGGRKK